MMKNKTGLSFVLGAIIGAAITWLYTSKEGKQLVAKAKNKVDDLGDEINKMVNSLQNKKTNENG